MKKTRLFFVLACFALFGMAICIVTYLFLPEPEENVYGVLKEGCMNTEEVLFNARMPGSEAEEEIRRLQEVYGIEVSLEEMEKQIVIRNEYEAAYGRSYPIEEVFLSKSDSEALEGDPGEGETYWDLIEKIEAYVDTYSIEESKYFGMTPKEELGALKEEYGTLEKHERRDFSANEAQNDSTE